MLRLSETHRFLKSPSFQQAQFALIFYISLLIIPCIIYYVMNKETLNLDWPTDPERCDWPNTTSTSLKCIAPFHNRKL